jgi:hypothetical protein
VVVGCSTYSQDEVKDGIYEAKILIGQKRGEVIKAAEKVFGKPKQIGSIFEKSDYEVELRRYKFTNVSDFVMYFHKGIFVQAGLMPVDSPEYPALRADYKSISAGKPGPVLGYMILMNNEEVVLDTIQP